MTEEQLQAIEDRSGSYECAHEDIYLVIAEVRRLQDMLPDCFREVTKEKMIEVFRDITKSMGIRVEDMIRMEGEVKRLDGLYQAACQELHEMCAELNAKNAEILRLREALINYGEHNNGPDHRPCPKSIYATLVDCTCGLDAAWKGQ